MREKDITGCRFGRLTALYRDGYSNAWQSMWVCRCDCGKDVRVHKNNLMAGRVRSCGCLRRDLLRAKHNGHGETTVGQPGQD